MSTIGNFLSGGVLKGKKRNKIILFLGGEKGTQERGIHHSNMRRGAKTRKRLNIEKEEPTTISIGGR